MLLVNFIKIVGREFKKFKELEELKDIDKKYYCFDFYDVDLNYCKVEVGTSLRFRESFRFWESKGWINKMDP